MKPADSCESMAALSGFVEIGLRARSVTQSRVSIYDWRHSGINSKSTRKEVMILLSQDLNMSINYTPTLTRESFVLSWVALATPVVVKRK